MKNNSFRLEEKTIVLTGPLTQHHISIVNELTECGASIGWVDHEGKGIERFSEQVNGLREIDANRGRVEVVRCDLTEDNQVTEALGQVAGALGGIDAYIDGMMDFRSRELTDQLSVADIEHMIDYQLKAPILMTREMTKILRQRRRGRILFLIGELQRHGAARETLNGSTRNGLISLTRSLAKEVPAQELTVNCLALAPTEEFLRQALDGDGSIASNEEKLRAKHPHLKLCRSESVAQTVCFLLSSLGEGINGQVIATG